MISLCKLYKIVKIKPSDLLTLLATIEIFSFFNSKTLSTSNLISSGRSSRQVSAVSEKLLVYLKSNYGILSKVEGLDTANWVLIDSGDILVNIFRPEVREYYQLEKMWMYS